MYGIIFWFSIRTYLILHYLVLIEAEPITVLVPESTMILLTAESDQIKLGQQRSSSRNHKT